MHFDFDGRYEDYQPIGGTIRRWDGVLLSVGVHVVLVLFILFAPPLPIFQVDPAKLQEEKLELERPRERPRFVSVQPRVDTEAPKPSERSDDSDKNRVARSLEPPRLRENPLPSARGNSPERTEAAPEERAAGRGPGPQPSVEPPAPEVVARLPEPIQKPPQVERPAAPQLPRPPQGGSLGDALRNLQKYVDQESFHNDKGQVQNLGPLQFDTKGVEFGPWIRRFVAQVRRNWFVPYAAMSLRGHVVLTFFVHRNGALTDVQVIKPSPIESFNTSAMNALLASNPTEPLPPEYPADKAFFTVTFYYNESPGGR
jgi:TonB family protein